MRTLKILFIGLTENSEIRGVERYVIELIKQLSNRRNIKITLLMGVWQNYYHILENDTVALLTLGIRNTKISRHLFIITKIKEISKSFDLVHYANTLPILFRNFCPSIFTIHDIAEYFVPKKYSLIQSIYRKIIIKLVVQKADLIITVSNFSKKSIHEKLSLQKDKIITIYNGIEHLKWHNVDKFNIYENNFILYFGAIENTKGIKQLISAFNKFKVLNPNSTLKLVLIGKEANAIDFLKNHLNQDIKYLGYLKDELLVQYIKKALAIFFISEYEGFGFPVLEGFLYNDNIVTSSTSSLGEIAKDFAWLVHPNNEEEILNTILSVIHSPKEFSIQSKDEILSKFSWEITGLKHIDVYLQVLDV